MLTLLVQLAQVETCVCVCVDGLRGRLCHRSDPEVFKFAEFCNPALDDHALLSNA